MRRGLESEIGPQCGEAYQAKGPMRRGPARRQGPMRRGPSTRGLIKEDGVGGGAVFSWSAPATEV